MFVMLVSEQLCLFVLSTGRIKYRVPLSSLMLFLPLGVFGREKAPRAGLARCIDSKASINLAFGDLTFYPVCIPAQY